MADETTTPETEIIIVPETTPTPAATGEKTFTQADMDRVVAERLARERKTQAEESKKQTDRAKLETEERLKVEREEADAKAADAEARARTAGYRADLKGEVVDVNAALRLVDDDKHVKDGAVDVKALLKDYPFLQKSGPTAPGAGGVQGADAPDPLSSLSAAVAADARGK